MVTTTAGGQGNDKAASTSVVPIQHMQYAFTTNGDVQQD